ncbi:MAG: hypothetical protein J6Y26_03155 [Lachnospiraceae bacterium]|nr:hypothetical protein [Lachnospiraceae bacterium]
MKWEDCAIYDLKHFRLWQRSAENLEDRIKMLDERMRTCRTVQLTGMPSNHGTGERTVDDTWIDCITEKENVGISLSVEQKRLKLIERGLAVLTEEELLVLTKFYIARTPSYLDDLCEALHVERSKVYSIRKTALWKFTVAEYGIDT